MSFIKFPTQFAAIPMYFAKRTLKRIPLKIVTSGVTRMSTFVFLETSIPSSHAAIAIIKTARGPPAFPSSFATAPTVTRLNRTRLCAPIANPIPHAIAAPTTFTLLQKSPASTKN